MYSFGMWDTVKIVGKGGSSTVYKAALKSDPKKFIAVKQIETDGFFAEQISNIKLEIATIRDLNHPNIISYLGTEQLENKIYILLEYADRGSLRQYYQRNGALRESQAASCIGQILAGLEYLHNKGIAHRDIKCANCLLTASRECKLADFGASKNFLHDSVISGLKGTPNWMSPEVIKGTQMTTGWLKADVWSLGCTVVEMVTGNLPYSYYDNPMTAMYHIASGDMPSFRDLPVSDELKALVVACCSADPTTRPTAVELRKLDFVSQLKQKYLKVVKGEVVVEQVVEVQISEADEVAAQEQSPTVREGIELSIDLFTSLDESTGSHIDEDAADSAKHILLNNTICVEDPLLASSTSSSSVSPMRRRTSITDSSMDTDAATVIHHQIFASNRPRDISPPQLSARSGQSTVDQMSLRTQMKNSVNHPPSHSGHMNGRTPVKSDAHTTPTNKSSITTSGCVYPATEISNTSATSISTRKDKSTNKSRSSQPSVTCSPSTSAKHLPRTFSGMFSKGISTTATTPSNSVRRAPNHNGPLVVKNPPPQDTKKVQEDKENTPKNAKNPDPDVRAIPNFHTVLSPAHSSSNFHASMSSSRSVDNDNSTDVSYTLKSLDETQNLDSSSHDTILNESDILKNLDRATRRYHGSSDADDNSVCENIVEDGIRFLSRSNSRCGLVSINGRPPPAQSPHSPSVHSTSPHTLSRKSLDLKVERGLRRINSITQEELKVLENSKSVTRLCPLDITEATADVYRRERSNSDVTLPVDVSYSRGTELICRKEVIIVGGIGAKSIPRPTAPLSGELRRIGDPCNSSSSPLDRLGPLGLFDTNFTSNAPVTEKVLGSLENKYCGGLSNASYSSSGQSTGHTSGQRSESGSEKLERIAHSGAASIRANALRESEILANQLEHQQVGPVISSQVRFKKSRKVPKKMCNLNFDGINDALRSFSGNTQYNCDADAYSSSSNSSSNSSSAHHSFRSQSAGMLSTAHSLGIDVGTFKCTGNEFKEHNVNNQLKPLGILGALGSGSGASAVHNSNISPHNPGLYPRTLGVNLSQHLLPTMNIMLPLQKRIIQSAPSLSRSTGVHLTGNLPPILSQSDLTTTTTRPDVKIVKKEMVHLNNKITHHRDVRAMGSNSEGNSIRGMGYNVFPDRL